MFKPHQIIRQQMVNGIEDDQLRVIIGSHFSAKPQWEDEYFDYVKTKPDYFAIYKDWVLSQRPYPFPKDEQWQYLRTGILGLPGHQEPAAGQSVKVISNQPLLVFLLDMLWPSLEKIINHGLSYYQIKIGQDGKELETESKSSAWQDRLTKAINAAAFSTLFVIGAEAIKSEGYPNFITAFLDKFKLFFAQEIGFKHKQFSADNKNFIQEFETEWIQLLLYSDNLYGFEVLSAIGTDDLLRYLRLPFTDHGFGKLSKNKTYQQAMNYVVSLASFKPMPDKRIKIYLRQQLIELFAPLVGKLVKRLSNKSRNRDRNKAHKFNDQELREIIAQELTNLTSGFDFFYATTNNLKRGKLSPFGPAVFPMASGLVKLGHLSSSDEYPFTDYITKKLEAKLKVYFENPDMTDDGHDSLDDIIHTDEEGNELTRLDTIEEVKEENKLYYPKYDALDKDGTAVGWKIKTFASIINKSVDALRRWDRAGYLKAHRYQIYSPIYRKQIPFRAYTEDQIVKAKQVDLLMRKKERHQE